MLWWQFNKSALLLPQDRVWADCWPPHSRGGAWARESGGGCDVQGLAVNSVGRIINATLSPWTLSTHITTWFTSVYKWISFHLNCLCILQGPPLLWRWSAVVRWWQQQQQQQQQWWGEDITAVSCVRTAGGRGLCTALYRTVLYCTVGTGDGVF